MDYFIHHKAIWKRKKIIFMTTYTKCNQLYMKNGKYELQKVNGISTGFEF